MDSSENERQRALDQYRDLVRKNIAQHGWIVQSVLGGDFAYTVGLTDLGWSEFYLQIDEEFLATEDPAASPTDIVRSATGLLNKLVQFYLDHDQTPTDRDCVRIVDTTGQRYDSHITTLASTTNLRVARDLYGRNKVRALSVRLERVPDDVGGDEGLKPDIEQTAAMVLQRDDPYVQLFPSTTALEVWVARFSAYIDGHQLSVAAVVDKPHAFVVLFRPDRVPDDATLRDLLQRAASTQHAAGVAQ